MSTRHRSVNEEALLLKGLEEQRVDFFGMTTRCRDLEEIKQSIRDPSP